MHTFFFLLLKLLACVTILALFANQSGRRSCPARYLTGQETSVQLKKSLYCNDFSDLHQFTRLYSIVTWTGMKLECVVA